MWPLYATDFYAESCRILSHKYGGGCDDKIRQDIMRFLIFLENVYHSYSIDGIIFLIYRKESFNMKNIFISYSHKDSNIAKTVSTILKNAGYKVWIDIEQIQSNINLLEKIKEGLKQSDVLLAIITENFINSNSAQAELGHIVFGSNTSLFTIKIGEILLPSYINGIIRHTYEIDNFDKFDTDIFLDKFNQLEESLNFSTDIKRYDKDKAIFNNIEEKIEVIRKELSDNRLTLVCGAGVSSSIGLPDWNTLLVRILSHALTLKHKDFSSSEMETLLSSSNLIVGKYLKILLGEEFDEVVTKSLYEEEWTLGDYAYTESTLISNIIELIRPKRNRGSVESVITFNFDSLLEEFLTKNSIKFKAIYDEGIKFSADEIPIYHVHGYLPRNEKIEKHNLVFSEDGYHTQFIDPYSWSNLIQLYKYMNNSCLFIGVSLSDPNLRRILDISRRKNEGDGNKHFIIKKLPPKDSSVYDLQLMLEEQDSLMLGLNVIWVSDYDEYPKVLEKILK